MDPIPSIWITDPQRKDVKPSYALSPTRQGAQWDGDFRKPTSPASKKEGTQQSSGPAASKVFRVLANNTTNAPLRNDSNGLPLESTITLDPLSQQIFSRTGEAPPLSRQVSNDTTHSIAESERPRPSRSPEPLYRADAAFTRQIKGKEKGVSFLSRIMGKKKDRGLARDDASIAESRPEGHHAEVFSPVTDDAEFDAPQPRAPDYIRVRTRHTKKKHFDSLFLAQELNADPSEKVPAVVRRKSSVPEPPTIWAAEFSKDGKYLATAGHDKIVRIWAVLTTPEERKAESRRTPGSIDESPQHLPGVTAQVFKTKPVMEYKGHSATILDLSWSKNNFLLSSSMDKTVRLWHVSRDECLCTFKHSDFVPAVAFHPKDDRFFLAGSLDCKIRLWSIPDKHVSHWYQTPEMITSVAFTPDGKTVIAGGANGLLTFYEAEGLRYQTQISVKSAHGKHSNGSKITGIQTFQHPLNSTSGDTKLLVTTNDSRIRLYNLRDKSVEMKLKGPENSSSQIRGSICDDQRYVCCGSEDSRAYIWPLDFDDHEDPTRRPLEHFQAHNSVITCVRFAPTKSRLLLSKSSDPIYELCTPPVTRASEPHSPSQASNQPSPDSSDAPAPLARQTSSPTTPIASRSTHSDGAILITCSSTGAIKVFRQDCAWRHRAPAARPGSSLSRPSSIKTKSSMHSVRSGKDSISTQPPSERILSWRQTISSSSNAPSVRTGSISSKHSTRSLSPRKSGQLPRSVSTPHNAASFARQSRELARVATTTGPGARTTPADGFVVVSGVSTPSGCGSHHASPALLMSGDSLAMTKIDDARSPPSVQRVGSTPTPLIMSAPSPGTAIKRPGIAGGSASPSPGTIPTGRKEKRAPNSTGPAGVLVAGKRTMKDEIQGAKDSAQSTPRDSEEGAAPGERLGPEEEDEGKEEKEEEEKEEEEKEEEEEVPTPLEHDDDAASSSSVLVAERAGTASDENRESWHDALEGAERDEMGQGLGLHVLSTLQDGDGSEGSVVVVERVCEAAMV